MKLMKEKDYKPYTGGALQKSVYLPKAEETISAYYPSKELQQAVELSRLLQRPLLLRGEPGCGKTRLAQAVAYELYGAEYPKYYQAWYIKSTEKARDGLYTFDHLRRLRDASAKEEQIDLKQYRDFGPLGKAIKGSTAEKPFVVLIDEIDKADLDFPNDLLRELDEKRFSIPETGETYPESGRKAYPPLVFITSNDEKELPAAFLRRCLFHYIEFPDHDMLMRIVRTKLEDELKNPLPHALLSAAISRFEKLHDQMKNTPATEAIPSTSALLDWATAIAFGVREKEEYKAEDLQKSLEDDRNRRLPYAEVLFKSYDDLRAQMGG